MRLPAHSLEQPPLRAVAVSSWVLPLRPDWLTSSRPHGDYLSSRMRVL